MDLDILKPFLHFFSKFFTNFFLALCYHKTSNTFISNHPINQKCQNNVLCGIWIWLSIIIIWISFSLSLLKTSISYWSTLKRHKRSNWKVESDVSKWKRAIPILVYVLKVKVDLTVPIPLLQKKILSHSQT